MVPLRFFCIEASTLIILERVQFSFSFYELAFFLANLICILVMVMLPFGVFVNCYSLLQFLI